MKTSNIILIVVIGSFTVLMVTGIIQNRYFSKPVDENQNGPSMQSVSADVPAFKYLVIQNQWNVNIKQSDLSSLVLEYENGQTPPTPDFHINGDTLYIGQDTETDPPHYLTTINLPEQETGWVKGVNSHLRFSGFYSPKLFVISQNCDVDFTAVPGKGIQELSVRAGQGSKINSNSFDLDTLDLQIDDSRVSIPVITKNLNGYIRNNSELNIKQVEHFNFSRDESSKLTHWN